MASIGGLPADIGRYQEYQVLTNYIKRNQVLFKNLGPLGKAVLEKGIRDPIRMAREAGANDDYILNFIDAVASAVTPDRAGNLASVCSDSGREWLMEMLNSPDQWAVCSSPDP